MTFSWNNALQHALIVQSQQLALFNAPHHLSTDRLVMTCPGGIVQAQCILLCIRLCCYSSGGRAHTCCPSIGGSIGDRSSVPLPSVLGGERVQLQQLKFDYTHITSPHGSVASRGAASVGSKWPRSSRCAMAMALAQLRSFTRPMQVTQPYTVCPYRLSSIAAAAASAAAATWLFSCVWRRQP